MSFLDQITQHYEAASRRIQAFKVAAESWKLHRQGPLPIWPDVPLYGSRRRTVAR
jgi:hypothetical protein